MIITLRDRVTDFFEWLDDIKIKHRHLVAALIISELLGIFILVWQLRAPLTQKYLATETKTYSFSDFNHNQRFVLAWGDFIVGNTKPSNKVLILLTEGDTKTPIKKLRLNVDQSGIFYYQTPLDIPEDKYRLTIGIFEQNNRLISIDTYKIKVISNSIFTKKPLNKASDETLSQDPINLNRFLEDIPSEEEANELLNSIGNLQITIPYDFYYSPSNKTEEPRID